MKLTPKFSYSLIGAFVLSIVSLLFTQCNTKSIAVVSSSQGPDFGAGKLDARCLLFHRRPDTTDLYFKIDVLELLPQSKVFSGEQLNLTTCIKWKNSESRDSLCKQFQLENVIGNGAVMGVMQFPMSAGTWDIMVEITEEKTRKKDILVMSTEKLMNANHADDFLCIHPSSGTPFFDNEILSGDSVWIIHSSGDMSQSVTRFCAKESKLPPPPFSDASAEVFSIADFQDFHRVSHHNKYLAFRAEEGYYTIAADNKSGMGLSFICSDSGLYYLSDPAELASSLRYITTKSEFDLIVKSPEVKKSIDNYWLECAGSKDRARELISLYYGRVQYANRYFSTFTKGWRTDRGLVYIIYGPPHEVSEDENYLRWYYEDDSQDGIIFNFKKSSLPHIGLNYQLERSADFKNTWEIRVQQWRHGKVYGKM